MSQKSHRTGRECEEWAGWQCTAWEQVQRPFWTLVMDTNPIREINQKLVGFWREQNRWSIKNAEKRP